MGGGDRGRDLSKVGRGRQGRRGLPSSKAFIGIVGRSGKVFIHIRLFLSEINWESTSFSTFPPSFLP